MKLNSKLTHSGVVIKMKEQLEIQVLGICDYGMIVSFISLCLGTEIESQNGFLRDQNTLIKES